MNLTFNYLVEQGFSLIKFFVADNVIYLHVFHQTSDGGRNFYLMKEKPSKTAYNDGVYSAIINLD